jgi:hypothetical protein
MPITVNRPARSTMGFIHGGGASGLLGLWRHNSSCERRPPEEQQRIARAVDFVVDLGIRTREYRHRHPPDLWSLRLSGKE